MNKNSIIKLFKKSKFILISLIIPISGCAVPYDTSYTYTDRNVGFYSNFPANTSVTIIENKPVPYVIYNNHNRPPSFNYYYNKRPPNYNRPNHNNNNWHGHKPIPPHNNQPHTDRWDRTGKNPQYKPPVQITPGKQNRCNRNSC